MVDCKVPQSTCIRLYSRGMKKDKLLYSNAVDTPPPPPPHSDGLIEGNYLPKSKSYIWFSHNTSTASRHSMSTVSFKEIAIIGKPVLVALKQKEIIGTFNDCST